MSLIPSAIFSIWFSGLLSLGIVGGSIYLLREWYQTSWAYDSSLARNVFSPAIGWNEHTAILAGGVVLLILAIAGGFIVRSFFLLFGDNTGDDRPTSARSGRIEKLQRPDGSVLQVEHHGLDSGPVLIFTHGWGTDSTEWYAVKRQLGQRFHIIVWDLPGLGKSTQPTTRNFKLEKFATDLKAVVNLAKGHPVILAGHSIGGMITLTFCRLFPESLGTQVAGLVLVHTTYTNPLRTTILAGLQTALERPVIIPMLYLTIWLSPVFRVMNWLSYVNGSAHIATKISGFASAKSGRKIDFSARYTLGSSPAVIARGMLGMLQYDATDILNNITVPTLTVAANHDPVCKPEASERINHEVPTSDLVSLSPARHMGFMEHSDHFAAEVGDFAVRNFKSRRDLRVGT